MHWNIGLKLNSTFLSGILTIGILATHAGATEIQNPFDVAVVDVKAGELLFQRHCGTCHGRDAKGGHEAGGPDLTTGNFQHASTKVGLFNIIREGVDGTAMIGLNTREPDQSVWQIVEYLNSLNIALKKIDLPGQPNAGQQIFNGKGKCFTCHMINGQGGRTGPDLSRIGERRQPDKLRLDLTNPNNEVGPRWWTMQATRLDGSVIEGLRLNEDTFTFRIIDKNENLWSFSKATIRSFQRIEDSTMPSVEQTLTVKEIDDLVAYLASLRKES